MHPDRWIHLDELDWKGKLHIIEGLCLKLNPFWVKCRNQYSKCCFWRHRKSEKKTNLWACVGSRRNLMTLILLSAQQPAFISNTSKEKSNLWKEIMRLFLPLCIISHLKKGKDLQLVLSMFFVAIQRGCFQQLSLQYCLSARAHSLNSQHSSIFKSSDKAQLFRGRIVCFPRTEHRTD